MKRLITIAIILTFFFITEAAAEISIKAEVDKNKITTDEEVTYKLVITSTEGNISQPQIPKFTGFDILTSAESSTISFVKGGAKTIVVYAFILAPTDKGKFKIGPSTIKIKDKTYSTDPFEIEVTQGKAEPNATPEEPSLPGMPQPERETEEPQITL